VISSGHQVAVRSEAGDWAGTLIDEISLKVTEESSSGLAAEDNFAYLVSAL
jgi:hypothetical protein